MNVNIFSYLLITANKDVRISFVKSLIFIININNKLKYEIEQTQA